VREPGPNKSGDVLQEHVARSHVTDDPSDGRPEPPVIVSTLSLSGSGERLTRETGSDELHSASPRLSVERVEVRPDRSEIQPLLLHPLHEDGRCVAVPLNVTHGSAFHAGVSEAELETSVAGAEVEGM